MNHQRAAITSAGLELDRHWVIVDRHGIFMTQRTYPKVALIQPGIDAANLTLTAPGMPAIIVPRQTACEPSDAVPVRIWAADTLGADEGGEVARDRTSTRLNSSHQCT